MEVSADDVGGILSVKKKECWKTKESVEILLSKI